MRTQYHVSTKSEAIKTTREQVHLRLQNWGLYKQHGDPTSKVFANYCEFEIVVQAKGSRFAFPHQVLISARKHCWEVAGYYSECCGFAWFTKSGKFRLTQIAPKFAVDFHGEVL